jgi:hypothetical protein
MCTHRGLQSKAWPQWAATQRNNSLPRYIVAKGYYASVYWLGTKVRSRRTKEGMGWGCKVQHIFAHECVANMRAEWPWLLDTESHFSALRWVITLTLVGSVGFNLHTGIISSLSKYQHLGNELHGRKVLIWVERTDKSRRRPYRMLMLVCLAINDYNHSTEFIIKMYKLSCTHFL